MCVSYTGGYQAAMPLSGNTKQNIGIVEFNKDRLIGHHLVMLLLDQNTILA